MCEIRKAICQILYSFSMFSMLSIGLHEALTPSKNSSFLGNVARANSIARIFLIHATI